MPFNGHESTGDLTPVLIVCLIRQSCDGKACDHNIYRHLQNIQNVHRYLECKCTKTLSIQHLNNINMKFLKTPSLRISGIPVRISFKCFVLGVP